jgi:ArsR family transcriptional regulator, arsenate/arsenite/antimonite-responsive transcriptional repressor
MEQYFKALGDSNRLRILNLLLHGELCVCDLQYVLDTTQPLVSRHLAYLKNSGMVIDRREGYRMYYRLSDQNPNVTRPLFEFLRTAVSETEQLQQDTARLEEAIVDGGCTVREWRPYSALKKNRPQRASVRGTAGRNFTQYSK